MIESKSIQLWIVRCINFLININIDQGLKDEFINLIETTSFIFGDEIKNSKQAPIYVKNIYYNQAKIKLQSLNESLQKFKLGEIELSGVESLELAKDCMKAVKKDVFAISYPDLDFWNGDGKYYFRLNREAILDRGVKITRFFVIRKNNQDEKVIYDKFEQNKFIELLKKHIKINEEDKLKKYKIYLTHVDLINFKNMHQKINRIPDISIFDDVICSEWIERAIILGNEERIDESRVSIRNEDLRKARNTKKYLLENVNNIVYEIKDEASIIQGLENIKTKIEERKADNNG